MRFILPIFFIFCLQPISKAQSLTITPVSETANNSTTEFLFKGMDVPITRDKVEFSENIVTSDIAASGLAVILNSESLTVFDVNGNKLIDRRYTYTADDKTYQLTVANNGRFVLRENVANFLFYNHLGQLQFTVSNSSQSRDGESVSEFAADPAFKTTVLYNPIIKRGGEEGSRARVIDKNGYATEFYYSDTRAIREVKVAENGNLIAVINYRNGTQDEVTITDRFGNELNSIPFDQSISGVQFSDDGRHITIYSNGRAGVYSILKGSRIGSTSFQMPVVFAKYFPQDNVIVALTGYEVAGEISNVELHAINIEQRSIERSGFNERLGKSRLIEPKIERKGANKYQISGFSKHLNMHVSF